jgi:hypothetical protein
MPGLTPRQRDSVTTRQRGKRQAAGNISKGVDTLGYPSRHARNAADTDNINKGVDTLGYPSRHARNAADTVAREHVRTGAWEHVSTGGGPATVGCVQIEDRYEQEMIGKRASSPSVSPSAARV